MLFHNPRQLEIFGDKLARNRGKFQHTLSKIGYLPEVHTNIKKKRDNRVAHYYMIRTNSYSVYMAYFSILSWAKYTDLENADIVITATNDELYDLCCKWLLPLADNITIQKFGYDIKLGYFRGSGKYDVINICDADLFVCGENKSYFATLPEIAGDDIHVMMMYSLYRTPAWRENIMLNKGWSIGDNKGKMMPLSCITWLPKMPEDWERFRVDFCRCNTHNDEVAILWYANHKGMEIKTVPYNTGFCPFEETDEFTLWHPWNGEQTEERMKSYEDVAVFLKKLICELAVRSED